VFGLIIGIGGFNKNKMLRVIVAGVMVFGRGTSDSEEGPSEWEDDQKTIYHDVCVDNPTQCDYTWDKEKSWAERLPWTTLFDESLFEEVGEDKKYYN
jgi:hypothetical protein